MDVKSINDLLARGEIDRDELWPHVREMESKTLQFRFEFGLKKLPKEPGLMIIRGPRQYGKSTWLELNLYESIKQNGKGSAYYLNGDDIGSSEELLRCLEELYQAFSPAALKRLFIDEITAIPEWERTIKRLIDRGLYRDVLIITTGSKALDLRRGSEKLPGRKGRLGKSEYIFLPVSYKNFYEKVGKELGDKAWMAYLLTGGSPLACNDIYQFQVLPEYFIQLVKDWVLGEIVSTGRGRQAIINLMQSIFRYGGQPVGFAKLARESGLANNTVASGYIEQLSDLLCLLPSWPWNPNTKSLELRKPCKFHFINMAVVVAWHPSGLRSIHDYETLLPSEQAVLIEWLVAQEVWRRSVLNGNDSPERMTFWQSKQNEIDFVIEDNKFLEVKRGQASPLDFAWFPKVFPKGHLQVICSTPFQSRQVTGITIHDFLLERRL